MIDRPSCSLAFTGPANGRGAADAASADGRLPDIDLRRATRRELQQRIETLENALQLARHLSDHDHLTGLANRRLLDARFTLSAAQATRHDQRLALLFLDLDRFKRVNDRYGHGEGDRLLEQFAERLRGGVRSMDTACRYGGDEFVVLLTEIDGLEVAAQVVAGIMARLAAPFEAGGERVVIRASYGLAMFPDDGSDLSSVLRSADRAMYRNKHVPDCNALRAS